MREGYIYKLVCLDENIKDMYIGSCWNMCIRYSRHKSNCYNENVKEHNYTVYQFIREHGGWDNWGMETIDISDFRDTNHLRNVEQFYIDVHGGIDFLLNDRDAVMDKEQYRIKNNKINSNIKQRHIDNKDFYCECCDYALDSNYALQRHYKTDKHINKMASSSS